MKVYGINNVSVNNKQNCNFKSSVPVFVHVCTDNKKAVPVIGEQLNNTFMLKVVHMLDNSLKRGINPERDSMTDRLIRYFRNRVNDYKGRVLAFTCVDGDFSNGQLKPYFYLTTGDTKAKLEVLRKKHKDAVKISQGYETANLQIEKANYYSKGKNAVVSDFKNFHPFGGEPQALHVYFKPERTKNNKIKDYILYNAEFKNVNDIDNPYIVLDKMA